MTAARARPSGAQVDLAVLLGLLALATVMRLPDLATRGTWDADQGHDMLVLRSFVRDGVVPLLGPPTSIGDVHHGAFYYYLLAPAALLTGGDSPFAVTLAIALAGVAAVGVVWWLARSMAASRPAARRRVRGRAGDGGVGVGDRGVDVHLEPEPHRPVELGRPRRRLAGLDDATGALVAPGGRRDGHDDAVPRPRASRCSRSSAPSSSPMPGDAAQGPGDGPSWSPGLGGLALIARPTSRWPSTS